MSLYAKSTLAGLLGVNLLFLLAGTSRGQASSELEKVFRDWTRRREQAHAVHYTAAGKGIFPKGRFSNAANQIAAVQGGVAEQRREFSPADYVFEKRMTLLLDREKNRNRFEQQSQDFFTAGGFFFTTSERSVLDGEKLKILLLRQAPPGKELPAALAKPNLMVMDGIKNPQSGFACEALHFAHGSIPTVWPPLRREGAWLVPDPKVFVVHGRGVHAGRPCLVLRTKPLDNPSGGFNELWVDEGRDSAVVRKTTYYLARAREKAKNPRRNRRYEVWFDVEVQYHRTIHGWLPERWVKTSYQMQWMKTSYQIKIADVERMRVVSVDIDPVLSPSDFEVNASTGTQVRQFQVGPDGKSSDRDMKVFEVTDKGDWNQIAGPRPARYWLWGLATIPLLAVGTAIWVSRRRRQKVAV